jgi:GrxC family glutaredoxin
MSKTVEIYTMDYCPYCIRAKNLLDKKNVAYTEHRVDRDPACLDEVVKRSGGRTTVPQIFVDGVHIGDCDEIHALEKKGKLDALLDL